MKKINTPAILKYGSLLLIVFAPVASCTSPNPHDDVAVEKNAVRQMTANIAVDISKKGPIGWLDYFEDAPGFFMGSDGTLAFTDYASAKTAILNALVKNISKITLNWSNTRVDVLDSTFASIGADFHEDIVLSNGTKLSVDGYFTGTAHFDGHSWKLRNLNWAIKAPAKAAN